MTDVTLDIGPSSKFNWRPLEQLNMTGKYLVLNMTPANELMIATAVIPEGLDAEVLHDMFKWAIAWDDFPEDLSVTVEPEAA